MVAIFLDSRTRPSNSSASPARGLSKRDHGVQNKPACPDAYEETLCDSGCLKRRPTDVARHWAPSSLGWKESLWKAPMLCVFGYILGEAQGAAWTGRRPFLGDGLANQYDSSRETFLACSSV